MIAAQLFVVPKSMPIATDIGVRSMPIAVSLTDLKPGQTMVVEIAIGHD
jgi:hypothetical protein